MKRILAILTSWLLVLPPAAFANFSAGTTFEVRQGTGGADTNGGCYFAGAGTDFSLQAAPQVVIDNATITATGSWTTITFTGGTHTVSTAENHNCINIISATGLSAPGWYQITNVSAGLNGTWTVDKTLTGMAGGAITSANMGGAFQSVAQACAVVNVNGLTVFIRNVGAEGANPYSITSASTNVSNGTCSNGSVTWFQGYTSTRSLGNTDARPTLQFSGITGATMFALSSGGMVQNVIIDCNSTGTSRGTNGGFYVGDLIKGGCATTAGVGTFRNTESTGNSSTQIVCGPCSWNYAHGNTATGIVISQTNGSSYHDISINNTGATTDGISSTGLGNVIEGCTVYGNGRHGVVLAGTSAGIVANCIEENNATDPINVSNGAKLLINNSYFGNGAGSAPPGTSSSFANIGPIVPSASVFTNAAGGNFSPNNTSGAGALVRAVANPTTVGSTSNFLDLGAFQSQSTGTGGVHTYPIGYLRWPGNPINWAISGGGK